MRKHLTRVSLVVGVAALAASALAATGSAVPFVSGTLTADGSSTVGPFATAAAEGFGRANKGANITVGISGTGGGFERFCKGETDMSNASRPIRYSEAKKCQDAGIRYIQFLVVERRPLDRRRTSRTRGRTASRPASSRRSGTEAPRSTTGRTSATGSRTCRSSSTAPGTDSGTFDFFTESDQRQAKAEPLRLQRERGRQRARARRLGRPRRARLLRLLLLRGEHEQAEAGQGRRRRRLRRSEHQDGAEPHATSRSLARCSST